MTNNSHQPPHKTPKRIRIETPAQHEARRVRQRAAAATKRAAKAAQPPESSLAKILIDLARENTLLSCETYFKRHMSNRAQPFRSGDWLSQPTPYLGREHVDVDRLSLKWRKPMTAWLAHRFQNGIETNKDPRYALYILGDYLFNYLPWWKELHPDAKVDLPLAPKDFTRFLFVARSDMSDAPSLVEGHQLPMTFLEMLAFRRPTPDTFNTVLVYIERFFQFVATAFENDATVAFPGMANPIRLYFDKKRSRRRTKTNKIPFDEQVFPHLVLFSQAVESFGEFLQQQAYEIDLFSDIKSSRPQGYDTEAYGYIPYVSYRGKNYPVRWIPGVFMLPNRSIQFNPAGVAGLYVSGHRINRGPSTAVLLRRIPHLGLVRMLMGLIETGLRGQALQWLDREKWDSENLRADPIGQLYTSQPSQMFTKMHVNTDKSKDQAWTTYISWRLRRSLLAEQYFQESLGDHHTIVAVPYENRENTRFASVAPLFRSPHKLTPYSDAAYSDYWKELLAGFQVYFNSRVGFSAQAPSGVPVIDSEPTEFLVLTPKYAADGVTPIETKSRDGGAYCSFTWAAINSPHACRATYATLRDGDMEVSDIAQQLGHASTVTTNHYQVPSERRLRAKLERAEQTLMQYDPQGSSSAYIHSEVPGSSLRQAFTQDRESTLADFNFIGGVSFWSTGDLDTADEDALALLRESPASLIKWHSTHVCPVGNQCPADIVAKIGGFRRCGLCPLAAKCVDHLPGIAAKKNELHENIRACARRSANLPAGDSESELANQLHRSMETDAKELMGWELSEQILLDQARRTKPDDSPSYHTHTPEIVRLQLERVSRNQKESEFFLQRIADSNAYPTLESDGLRAKAAKYVRILLAKAGRLEEAANLDIAEFDELKAFASLVKPMAEAKGLTSQDFSEMLDSAPVFGANSIAVSRHPLLDGPDSKENS